MGEIVELGLVADSKRDQARDTMVKALEGLLERAQNGQVASVCFVSIPTNRETLGFGLLHLPDCGIHEMIGATTILSDHLRSIVRD